MLVEALDEPILMNFIISFVSGAINEDKTFHFSWFYEILLFRGEPSSSNYELQCRVDELAGSSVRPSTSAIKGDEINCFLLKLIYSKLISRHFLSSIKPGTWRMHRCPQRFRLKNVYPSTKQKPFLKLENWFHAAEEISLKRTQEARRKLIRSKLLSIAGNNSFDFNKRNQL